MNHETEERTTPDAMRSEDYRSDAGAAVPWRHLRRFFVVTASTGFVVNAIWEMAQMPAFVETAGDRWTNTLGLCTWAAVGDVGILVSICAAGALATADPGWSLRGRRSVYLTAALLGLAYAVLVEHAALLTQRWSYTERMPVVPVLAVGLWPLLQMTVLPPLTLWLARWWVGRDVPKSSS